MTIPLIVLAALSLAGGWIETPPLLGNLTLFSDFVQHAVPPAQVIYDSKNDESELILELFAMVASLGAIALAYLLFLRYPAFLHGLMLIPSLVRIRKFWGSGWGFDWLYDRLFVQPYLWLAHIDQHDVIDKIYSGAMQLCLSLYRGLSATQTGQVRLYAAAIAAGSIGVLFIGIFA
jgi:NADH-quinone oxidoreductase subunit L